MILAKEKHSMSDCQEKTLPYSNLDYYSPQRMAQYYYQIKVIREAKAEKVLEIGPGPGAVTHILRKAGLEVLTCDCEKRLEPNLCGDIRELPLADDSVDFSLCCQVLEHLPFDDFSRALLELKRVTRKQVLISIPYVVRVIYSLHKYPGGRRSSWVLHIPWLPVRGKPAPGHLWEMGRKGYSKKRIINTIRAAGFQIKDEFTPVDSPQNQYFLLQK
jgi:ubiquinone/menaquinone biosynthesis C-methylase UbiE